MAWRSVRVAVLGESPCQGCWARCCKQKGHEYAVLLEGEEVRRFAAFSTSVVVRGDAGTRVERVIGYREGRCPFLGEDDRCTIYEDRPVNCRRFQCVPGYNQGGASMGRHSEFLERNPDVRLMIEAL